MPCRAVVCRDFETQVADGRLVAGHNDTYHANQPLAYGCDPAENVVFIGCHDNDTMFDQVCGAIERIIVCIACMQGGRCVGGGGQTACGVHLGRQGGAVPRREGGECGVHWLSHDDTMFHQVCGTIERTCTCMKVLAQGVCGRGGVKQLVVHMCTLREGGPLQRQCNTQQLLWRFMW